MKEEYIVDYGNMVRCSVINRLIQENDYKKYLEIGVFDSHNFNNVEIQYKVGVDPGTEGFNNVTFPMTSDEFFDLTDDKFDIIFCDGLHYSEQTYKDNNIQLNKNLVDLAAREKSLTTRYTNQFGSMETAMTGFNSTKTLLENFMEAWKKQK